MSAENDIDLIRYMDRDGDIHTAPSETANKPVIWTSIPHTITPQPNGLEHVDWGGEGNEWRKFWALVDTGADLSYIDPGYADRTGLPRRRDATVFGATSSIQTYSINWYLHLIDSRTLIPAELIVTPLIENGRKFPVVIGMNIIRHGRLIMDGESKNYSFKAWKIGS